MNSMHNSFGGSGGGYANPYSGYVPTSALPYYNGYPSELAVSQTAGAYYSKHSPAMPGYSSSMTGYATPNSIYYQQYSLGYQYGYSKYGLSAGLHTGLGYGTELAGPTGLGHTSLGGLQAPTTDLGLTGSMFSKGSSSSSSSSSSKFLSIGNSSHSQSSQSSSALTPVTPTPASPHVLASAMRRHLATPSPPVDNSDGKKDLEKMKRCQLCGQVFRLMSECLAHMKAVHESPMSVYGMHPPSHSSQSMIPHHIQSHPSPRTPSLSAAPDSPLMALERMGWGKEQSLVPTLHSSPTPISQSYQSQSSVPQSQTLSTHHLSMAANPHMSDTRYAEPNHQTAKRLTDYYSVANVHHYGQEHNVCSSEQINNQSVAHAVSAHKTKKSSSYSVSSIIGENSDSNHDRRDGVDGGASEPPQVNSPSLPPSLTPNLPITSIQNLPPNLSPNLPAPVQPPVPSQNINSHPPQLTPNIPSIPQVSNVNSNINQQPPTLLPSYASTTYEESISESYSEDVHKSSPGDHSDHSQHDCHRTSHYIYGNGSDNSDDRSGDYNEIKNSEKNTNYKQDRDMQMPRRFFDRHEQSSRHERNVDSETNTNIDPKQSFHVVPENHEAENIVKQHSYLSTEASPNETRRERTKSPTDYDRCQSVHYENDLSHDSTSNYNDSVSGREDADRSNHSAFTSNDSNSSNAKSFSYSSNESRGVDSATDLTKCLPSSTNAYDEQTESKIRMFNDGAENSSNLKVEDSWQSVQQLNNSLRTIECPECSTSTKEYEERLTTHPNEEALSSQNLDEIKNTDCVGESIVASNRSSKNNVAEQASKLEDDIGDEDEPGDPQNSVNSCENRNKQDLESTSLKGAWQVTGNEEAKESRCTSPESATINSVPLPVPSLQCVSCPSPSPLVQQRNLVYSQSSETSSPQPQYYHQVKVNSPYSEYADKSPSSGNFHLSQPIQPNTSTQPQPNPYHGNWASSYSSNSSYSYHPQYGPQSNPCVASVLTNHANANKMPSSPYTPHSRYPQQYSGSSFDSRRGMPNPYPTHQNPWYPVAPGRCDSKSPWSSWPTAQSSHAYPHSYYYGSGSSPSINPHMPQGSQNGPPPMTSPQHKYSHTSPTAVVNKSKTSSDVSSLESTHTSTFSSSNQTSSGDGKSNHTEVSVNVEKEEVSSTEIIKEKASKPTNANKSKLKANRPGPKSRVERRCRSNDSIHASEQTNSLSSSLLTPPATTSVESSDSSEPEVEEEPRLCVLKPPKRFRTADGTFVGPKRVKLAKMVKERRQSRQKLIEEQIKQSELEEQLAQQLVERASAAEGPLANVLVQSTIILGDNNVEEPDLMDQCVASMTTELLANQNLDLESALSGNKSSNTNTTGSKKPNRKTYKVLHNNNSVVIRSTTKRKYLPKLRAKDFKWSHYVKSMRHWCKDCGHGFKNPKECNDHSDERCKNNCLYMLECYVKVTDIVQHRLYGSKVEELLEEYQVDGEHKCKRCTLIFSRKADFVVHVDTHKDFMPWECTICGTRFKIRGSLKEHLRYTHMKGRVPCLKCNKVFATSTLLRQHVKVHTQHYKYSRSGKNREDEVRAAREAEEEGGGDPDGGDLANCVTGDQLSHEANEYRNWCKLMELNAMKNLATSDVPPEEGDTSGLIDEEVVGAEECEPPIQVTS